MYFFLKEDLKLDDNLHAELVIRIGTNECFKFVVLNVHIACVQYGRFTLLPVQSKKL